MTESTPKVAREMERAIEERLERDRFFGLDEDR